MIHQPGLHRRTQSRSSWAPLTALLLAACGGRPPTFVPVPAEPLAPAAVTPGALSTIAIWSDAPTVAINATVQFGAVGQDSEGSVVALVPVWSVTAGSGTISAAGLYRAGTATGTFSNAITVTSGGISAHASINVTGGPLATIAVSPGQALVAAGSTLLFNVTGADAYGNAVSASPLWSVVGTGGTITGSGLFKAGSAAGTFPSAIKARQGAIAGFASITVRSGSAVSLAVTPGSSTLAINASRQFIATAKDSAGNSVPISPIWSVGAGGTITDTGLFTAGTKSGSFANAVVATLGPLTATSSVTVSAGALARLTLTPTTASLPVSGTQQFFATGRDAYSNIVAVTPSWSVVAGGGTISPGGLFTAGRSIGIFIDTVKVTGGGFADWISVTVTPDDLKTITVSPSAAVLAPGTTQNFVAFGRDSNGNGVAISPTWSAGPQGVISSAGLYMAGPAAGTYPNTISASVGGVVGHSSVTVTAGPLAVIAITNTSVFMAMSSTLQFTATGTDVNGNPVSLTPSWSIVAGGGTISDLGLFTSGTVAGTFTETVRAASGALSTYATVTVTPGPLATISLTPSPTTLDIGSTQQFTATGQDAYSNSVALSPVWSVLTGGGAIDSSGLFIAGSVAGTFNGTIRGTSGSISGYASVIVNAGPLATIVVTGNTPSMLVGTTRQLTALGSDAYSNSVPMAATWSVVAGGGTVSSSGLFTAGSLAGVFTNTVLAASGNVSGLATMTVTAAPPPPDSIVLGAAKTFAVLAGSAVTNSGATALTGDVGLDPGGPTAVTGFPPGIITGTLHVNDALAVAAQTDLTTAFLAAQGKVCPTGHNLSGIDLGASPFAPGVWCFSTSAALTGTLVLDGGGDTNSVFIFQAGSTLLTATSSDYLLLNGAQAKNVYWQVGSSATLGVSSALPGTILALTDITLTTGSTLLGRALARNGMVTLAAGAVTAP